MRYNKEWLRPDEFEKILSLPNLSEKYEVWMLLLYSPALRCLRLSGRDIEDHRNTYFQAFKGYKFA